ncbi:MAG: hypothetical protein QXV69_10320 [Sulfolobaceae archaeon]
MNYKKIMIIIKNKTLILILIFIILLAVIDMTIFSSLFNNQNSKIQITSTTTFKNNPRLNLTIYISQPYSLLLSNILKNYTFINLNNIILLNSLVNFTPDIIISNGFYDLIYPKKVKWVILLGTDEVVFATNGQEYNYLINSNLSMKGFFDYITSGLVKIGSVNPLSSFTGIYFKLILEAAGEIFYKNSSYYLQRCLINSCAIEFSSDLEALTVLENNGVQFIVTYKSLADRMNLKYIQLPPYLNFGNENYSNFYSEFSYIIKLYNQNIQIKGEPNFLYITAFTNSGVEFIYQLILSGGLESLLNYSKPKIIFTSLQDLPPKLSLLLQEEKILEFT